jgi:UDP-N-acetylmuramoylalanine--D-glutamate ligase
MRVSFQKTHVIVGLGQTGLSCAHFLASRDLNFSVMDTRMNPPCLAELQSAYPETTVKLGGLDTNVLKSAQVLVLSPGIDPRNPAIVEAKKAGALCTGDVELFATALQEQSADGSPSTPVIAITGSNAKSTVATLVAEMARNFGLQVVLAGNIGFPVLNALLDKSASKTQLYVLELSSFQLETSSSLQGHIATLLNLSEDHLDRYDSLDAYLEAKQRIFSGCKVAIVNRDDVASLPAADVPAKIRFGLGEPTQPYDFGLRQHEGIEYLARGESVLIPINKIKIPGRHNLSNCLAALALGTAAGISQESMLQTLQNFVGLDHRCQWVAEISGVQWYNDSKGTNIGATVAALAGLGNQGSVYLLAGGLGKGADFSPLSEALTAVNGTAILFGKDAGKIQSALADGVSNYRVNDLQEAVKLAASMAKPGEQVLLSPACASFDMFKSYVHRGEVFVELVRALQKQVLAGGVL